MIYKHKANSMTDMFQKIESNATINILSNNNGCEHGYIEFKPASTIFFLTAMFFETIVKERNTKLLLIDWQHTTLNINLNFDVSE